MGLVGFLGGSEVKTLHANAGNPGFDCGQEIPREGSGNPLSNFTEKSHGQEEPSGL